MTTDISKALSLAGQISAKAEETLAGLEYEMKLMKWPAEFKAVMWEAVSDAAKARATTARF